MTEPLDVIREDVTATAQLCAATARELAQMAYDLVPRISAADPMETQDILQGIAVLTKMANEASTIGRALLAQQKTAKPVSAGEHEIRQPMKSVAAGIVTSLNARRGKR